MNNQDEIDNEMNDQDLFTTEYDEWDDYEDSSKYQKILADDNKYLDEFELSLQKQGLRPKTIRKHVENVRFFLITYLLGYHEETMQEGISSISSYLGDWFIRKTTWSSANSIKQNITSFKKFYKSMLENKNISKEQYDKLLNIIKERKDEWISEVNLYNHNFNSWYNKYSLF